MKARLLTICVLSLTACAGEAGIGGAGDAVTVRDSAGIQIVESSAPLHPAGSWTLGALTPLCSAHGDDRVGLVSAVVPLAEDTVAVMAGQDQRLLLCAGSEVVASFGRRGEGPGEYRFVRAVRGVSADTVALVEGDRVTFLNVRTGGVRTLAPDQVNPGATHFVGSAREIAASRVAVQADPGRAPPVRRRGVV